MDRIHAMIAAKNCLVQTILNAKMRNMPVPDEMALSAAKAEVDIADALIENGWEERAVVNLVSAGALYGSAGATTEEIAVYRRAKTLTKLPKMLAKIESFLKEAGA